MTNRSFDQHRRLAYYQRSVGLFGIVLLASTWRLWVPQTEFPQVPLIRLTFLTESWSDASQYSALVCMLVGLVGLLVRDGVPDSFVFARKLLDFVPLCYVVGFAISVIADQHRLQPWAFQFMALAILFTSPLQVSSPEKRSAVPQTRWVRLLVIGIYFWSALGKFDYQFAYTVGTDMVREMAAWLGFDTQQSDRNQLALFALALPTSEGILVALLCWPRYRRVGCIMAVAMHVGLLFVLGPFGLDHRPGVLWWNAFFIVQVALLFWTPSGLEQAPMHSNGTTIALPSPSRTHSSNAQVRTPAIASSVILLMIGLPALERFGWYDHWPSWALYAPHSSRVVMSVPRASIPRLPESLQPIMRAQVERMTSQGTDIHDVFFVRVPLEQWSLETLAVPIYPQARFQLGVAIAVAEEVGLDRELRAQLKGPADRWSGERRTLEMSSMDDLRKASSLYILNAR